MIGEIKDMTPEQFRDWLREQIVEGLLFTSREKLIALLAADNSHESLEREFREFFNGYCGLAFWLEYHEDYVLSVLETQDIFVHLRHRVAKVKSVRKTSPDGRIARKMGGALLTDPQPEIKVTELSVADFRAFVDSVTNLKLFASRERLVKLINMGQTSEIITQLRSEFWEFFVCYLELEQFLEDYDYDPDEGLELRPEFIEELKREEEYIKSGGKMFTLEEVAKELGISLKCMN